MMDDVAGAGTDVPQWLDALMWISVVLAVIWVAFSLFVYLRRRASNLTSVHEAGVKKDATPDFLSVDQKARKEALARGEDYEDTLDKREAEAAAIAAGVDKKEPVGLMARLSGLASLLFSVFTLFSAVMGVIMQMERVNSTLGRADQIMLVVQKYPIPVAVCVFVIGFHIVNYFTRRKWKEAAK